MVVVLTLVLGITQAHSGTVLHFKKGALNTDSQASFSQLATGQSTVQQKTNFFVVQFKNKITVENKKFLRRHGEIINYVPEDAYLIKASVNSINKIKVSTDIQAVVPFFSSFRVSDQFASLSVFNASNKARVVIKLTSNKELEPVLSQLKGHSIVASQGKTIYLDIKLQDLPALSIIEGVEWIEPYSQPKLMHIDLQNATGFENQGQKTMDDITGFESGTKIMNFDTAWARGYTGLNQIVSMADTGLDSGKVSTLHSDFQGVLSGQAFGMFARDWSDPMGHGTHVAGSVIGNGSKSQGLIKGGAYNSSMIAQGMWSPVMENLSVPPELSTMFQAAYDLGARIHTNSWGSPKNLGVYDVYAGQVDAFMWEHPDMLILFAAGNSGQDLDKDGRIDPGSVSSPATAKNVLAVGASENYLLSGGNQTPLGKLRPGPTKWSAEPISTDLLSDNANGIAAFSSRGPALDGRLKPEIVAPGTNIVSLCSTVEGSSPLWGGFNEDYCYSGGTSMSTPLVAGAAAVVREFLIFNMGIAVPSASLIKAVLMSSTDDLFPGQFGFRNQGQELLVPGPNNDQGYGRVNMEKATQRGKFVSVVDDAVSLEKDYEYNVPVGGSGMLNFVLVYTDAPSSISASKALVNDIDMYIQDPDTGVTYGVSDRVNNHESVILTGIQSSYVKVIIRGHNLPVTKNGKVPFSVVVTR